MHVGPTKRLNPLVYASLQAYLDVENTGSAVPTELHMTERGLTEPERTQQLDGKVPLAPVDAFALCGRSCLRLCVTEPQLASILRLAVLSDRAFAPSP